MADLPAPVTVTDELLVAVAQRLDRLIELAEPHGGGEVAAARPGEQVELTEPKPAKTARRARSSS